MQSQSSNHLKIKIEQIFFEELRKKMNFLRALHSEKDIFFELLINDHEHTLRGTNQLS